MLRSLIFLLISICYSPCARAEGNSASCRSCSSKELARENGCYQNNPSQDSFFKLFEQDSLRKVKSLQKDPTFQEILGELQPNNSKDTTTFSQQSKKTSGQLYLFISFSMGEKALLNLAYEAKQFGATLLLRGFKNDSYLQTVKTLQRIITKTGKGVLIDPELYALFHITAVPTFVLAKPFTLQDQTRIQTPIHDKLQGHVSIRYALEQFASEGDLREEAQILLKNSLSKSGGRP